MRVETGGIRTADYWGALGAGAPEDYDSFDVEVFEVCHDGLVM